MLFTAALSLSLGLGSSLVAASPISSGFNTMALLRGCDATTSKEFVTRAEAHFTENKVLADVKVRTEEDAPYQAIPVCCTLGSLHFSFAMSKLAPDFCVGHEIHESISKMLMEDPIWYSEMYPPEMNSNYVSCGISFYLADVDRSPNASWFNQAGPGK